MLKTSTRKKLVWLGDSRFDNQPPINRESGYLYFDIEFGSHTYYGENYHRWLKVRGKSVRYWLRTLCQWDGVVEITDITRNLQEV